MKKALEERTKPTVQELEANYACFWEHALRELAKPVARQRRLRPCQRRLSSQCSWPTDCLSCTEAAALKEEFTIAYLVRKVQVALSKAQHNWPYARALYERGPKSICSWPTPRLHDTQAARYKMRFSRAVELRRNAVVLSNLRAYGAEHVVVLSTTPVPHSVSWLNKYPLLATSGLLMHRFQCDLQAARCIGHQEAAFAIVTQAVITTSR